MSLFIAFLAGAAAFLICTSIFEMIERKKEEKYALYDEITNTYEEEMRNVKTVEQRTLMEKLEVLIVSSGIPLDLQEFLIVSVFIYGFTVAMTFSLVGVMSLILGLVPLFVIYQYMQFTIKNRNVKVVKQLPDFAVMFASGYEAGYSIENCFDYCAKELKFPINEEMEEIFDDITRKKLSLTNALNNWYERNPNEDIHFVIKGLLLCQEKSGDVATIMRSLQEKLRDRQYIDRFIQKRTQNLRYTAKFIQAAPVLALGMGFLSDPNEFMEFATSGFGIIGFVVSAVLYIGGTVFIKKSIKKVYKD